MRKIARDAEEDKAHEYQIRSLMGMGFEQAINVLEKELKKTEIPPTQFYLQNAIDLLKKEYEKYNIISELFPRG